MRSAPVGRKVSSLSRSTLGPCSLFVPASPCLNLGPGILASSLDVDILTVPSPVLVLQKFLPLSFYLTQEKKQHIFQKTYYSLDNLK